MENPNRYDQPVNEVQEFIADFKAFWSRYGNSILITVTVAVLVFTVYRVVNAQAQSRLESAWSDLAGTTSPVTYQRVAQEHSVPAVTALARLRGADLLLAETLRPQDDAAGAADAPAETGGGAEPPGDAPVPGLGQPESPEAMLDEAAALYEAVLEDGPADVYRLNALLGLGSIAESRQQWDRARSHYERAIEMAGPGHEALRRQAQTRMDLLDRLAEPIALAPDPEPLPNAGGGDAGAGEPFGTPGLLDTGLDGFGGGFDALDGAGLTPGNTDAETGGDAPADAEPPADPASP